MSLEEAIAIIRKGGTLAHQWTPGEPIGDIPTMQHNEDCNWCEAVRTLEYHVLVFRREQNEADLNRSW